MSNGKQMLATAEISEIVSKVLRDKTVKRVRRHIGTSPGYVQGADGEVSFIATCPDTKKQYRIIGQVEEYVPKIVAGESVEPNNQKITNKLTETSVDVPVEDVVTNTSPYTEPTLNKLEDKVCNSDVSPTICIDEADKLQSEQHQLEAFEYEMKYIKAQIKAGIDPLISINALMHMSLRSHATLYRDFKNGKLKKNGNVGRNCTVKYSIARAYLDGV